MFHKALTSTLAPSSMALGFEAPMDDPQGCPSIPDTALTSSPHHNH